MPVRGDMSTQSSFTAETHGHTAILNADLSVSVFRKAGMALSLIGTGRWENGTILGSGVNCGVLVRLEEDLRRQTGTP